MYQTIFDDNKIRDDLTHDSFVADIYFYLIRKVDCKTSKLKEIYLQKLDRLKDEDFNRVKVPSFHYEVDGNIVTCVSQFVKGLYAFTSEQRRIIYEDVVNHDSEWTFSDYGYDNFLVEESTNTIFSVDFQSYRYYPDLDKRKRSWETQSNISVRF